MKLTPFYKYFSSFNHEVVVIIKAVFISLWDGLNTDHSCQIVMGASNHPQDLDSAIMRVPTRLHVNQPASSKVKRSNPQAYLEK